MDALYDDYRTLQACALVYQGWLYPARKNLFHTVVLDSEARARRLRVLIAESIILANYIQVLHFDTHNHYMRRIGTVDLQSWVMQFLPFFARTLRFVNTLHFDYIQWNTLRGFNIHSMSILSEFGSVESLHLRGCKFGTFESFERVVLTLSRNVKDLTLCGLTWEKPDCLKEGYHLPLLHLRVISGCSLNHIYRWLAKTRVGLPTGTLRNLEFGEVHDEADLMNVGKILREIGPHLHTLKIGCDFPWRSCTDIQGRSLYKPHD